MLLVNEGIFQSQQMVVVVLVVLAVELCNLDISRSSKSGKKTRVNVPSPERKLPSYFG